MIAAAVAPPPNAAGWHRTDPTVAFTCADATSGVAAVSRPVTVTTEGAGQVVTGTCTDVAGNTARVDVAINLDKTPPPLTPNLTSVSDLRLLRNADEGFRSPPVCHVGAPTHRRMGWMICAGMRG